MRHHPRRRARPRPSSRCRGASCAAWSSGSPTRTRRTATPWPASRPSAPRPTPRRRSDERLVTVVGTLPDLQPGEAIVASRLVAQRPQARLAVQGARLPHHPPGHAPGDEALPRLAGWSRGSGRSMAGRIVDAFGEATFDVIDDDPERLTEVPGIGPVRAGRIAATWVEQRHIREVMAALQGYGVSTSLAVRIYKRFGDDSGPGHRPGAVPPGPRGLGHRLQDRRQDRPGGRHRRRRARAAAGRGAARARAGRRRGPHPAARGGRWSSRRRRCSGPRPRRSARRSRRSLGDRRAGRGHARTERRASRLLALAPFARAESGLASRLQALHGAAGRDAASAQIFAGVDWDGRLRLAGRAARPDAGPRAGGRRCGWC